MYVNVLYSMKIPKRKKDVCLKSPRNVVNVPDKSLIPSLSNVS